MTKLEFANKFIFQLFFIRLTRCEQRVIDKSELIEFSQTEGGCFPAYRITASHQLQWYSLMYWVIPFTGWSTKFKFIGEQKLLDITKKVRL